MNQSKCKSIFDYKDGMLFWRFDRGSNAKSGNRAGRLLGTGYRSVHVSGRRYQEHRLVFLWNNGYLPSQIDHINGKKSDNRIENLREANHSQNQINTEDRCGDSGFRGVRFVPSTGRWSARIYQNGKEIRVGTFDTSQLASDAYNSKAKEIYGDFVR